MSEETCHYATLMTDLTSKVWVNIVGNPHFDYNNNSTNKNNNNHNITNESFLTSKLVKLLTLNIYVKDA